MKSGKNWIQKAIKKPGSLRKSLGVKKGQKIPAKKLNAAAKKGGKLGQRARLAKTLKGVKKKFVKRAILQALQDRYNAQISEADATLKIYLENSVGIGEHPQHIDEVDKLIEKIATAEEKLKTLQEFKI